MIVMTYFRIRFEKQVIKAQRCRPPPPRKTETSKFPICNEWKWHRICRHVKFVNDQ